MKEKKTVCLQCPNNPDATRHGFELVPVQVDADLDLTSCQLCLVIQEFLAFSSGLLPEERVLLEALVLGGLYQSELGLVSALPQT